MDRENGADELGFRCSGWRLSLDGQTALWVSYYIEYTYVLLDVRRALWSLSELWKRFNIGQTGYKVGTRLHVQMNLFFNNELNILRIYV